MKIAVLTNDKYLYRKAELELCNAGFTVCNDAIDADAIVLDTEYTGDTPDKLYTVKLSWANEEGCLGIPFAKGELKKRFAAHSGTPRLTLDCDTHSCTLDAKRIPLTSHEFALLKLLKDAAGEYVTRELIMESVFGGKNDRLLNLYVHYLRDKLETGGEKIIFSSRGNGYRISADLIKEG
jgi:hypothetical protein